MSISLEGHGLWLATGLLLAGYGALVLLGVLAHESAAIGLALVLVGAGLIWTAGPSDEGEEDPHRDPDSQAGSLEGRRAATLGLGTVSAGGVLVYNAWAGSALSLPEVAILVYGVGLLAAASFLERSMAGLPVETLVAWSLPLVAAPLGVYALDAALDAGVGSSPLDLFIRHALVPPMAASLDLLGFDVANHGQTLGLETSRGTLFLSVGLVCAGLQPGILFLGILGLHTWREGTSAKATGGLLAAGAFAVYAMNLVRLVLLAVVGHRWGGQALQTVHAHAGWVLFLALVVAFWGLVLPRIEKRYPEAI